MAFPLVCAWLASACKSEEGPKKMRKDEEEEEEDREESGSGGGKRSKRGNKLGNKQRWRRIGSWEGGQGSRRRRRRRQKSSEGGSGWRRSRGGEKGGKLFLPSLPLPVSFSLGMALREEEGRGGRIEIGFQETREGGFAGVGGGPISKRG